jgi:hypothetical protein
MLFMQTSRRRDAVATARTALWYHKTALAEIHGCS